MPKNTNLSPETTQEIIALANDMTNVFSPPELIPGCEVLSITDKDQYATDNGWIEAICGKHNNQRCRWKAKFSNVQVGDYVDVLYFKSVSIFEVFGKGGGGSVSGLPLTTKGDLLGYSTLPNRYPVSGNDGYVLTEDSGETFGFSWQAAGGGGGWPYTNVLTVDPSDADADYSTITLAIAGATAGDAIWIGNATYSENVTVNKKLYLIGASREGVIIDGTFTTTTADCVIENLTIFRDDAGSSAVNLFTAGADATLRRVTLSGLTVTTTGALNGIYNINTYEITTEDCTIKLADTSSSATHGIYVDAASAVVSVVDGIIDAQSSGGTAYDVRINEDGTINLRDTELVNNTLDTGGGTITGEYTSRGESYRATLGTSIITAFGYSDPISPFASLPGLIGLWYGGNYQRSTGDMPNLAPYIQGASSQDLSYNGTNHGDFDYLANGIGYVDLNGTDNYFSVADNTDLDITGTEAIVGKPGLTYGIWINFDDNTPAAEELLSGKVTSPNDVSFYIFRTTTGVIFGSVSNLGTFPDLQSVNIGSVTASGGWHLVVHRFVPSTTNDGWLDGEKTSAATTHASIYSGAGTFEVGAFSGGASLFNGKFSTAFLCASALNDATIQSIFQQTRSLYGV